MSSRFHARAALVGALLACLSAPVSAGQVRVNVASNLYSPANLSVTLGDHVVWVWTGGTHDVVSGNPNTGIGDGRFTSVTPTTGSTYSWKSNGALGSQDYFCSIHLPSMAGTLNLVATGGAAAADFRITEVLFNPTTGEDLVEIANLGATGDLSKYRLKINGLTVLSLQVAASGSGATTMSVPANGRVVLHLGASGTNTTTDLYFPAASLGNTDGTLALYVPNTRSTSLADATQIIDFVRWGSLATENMATAVSAGYWLDGAALTGVAPGRSIEFCGSPGQYGAQHWAEVATSSFGSNGACATPAIRTTWGRVKSLYR